MSDTVITPGTVFIHDNREMQITGWKIKNGTLVDLKLYVADLLRQKATELEREAGREVVTEVIL